MTALELGFGLPVSGSWAGTHNAAENVVTIAQEAEAAGYRSLWTFQRLLHPVGAKWGAMYESVTDPLITLGYTAAVTQRARLGLAILNAPFFSPILLAKQLSTLDILSHGRLDTGLGLGWAEEEFTAAGVDFARRGARVEEFTQCLKAIWTQPEVSFQGEFYQVPASLVEPKPVQSPHPPLLLGGDAGPALRRIGRVADGWITRSRHDLTRLPADLAVIAEAAAEAGRDSSRLRVIVRGVLALSATTSDDGQGRKPLHGTVVQIKDDLNRLAEQGVSEVFIDPNFDPTIGSPHVDARAALDSARHLLETFAPGSGPLG
jgi:probable F420-dependent oxidoreductase